MTEINHAHFNEPCDYTNELLLNWLQLEVDHITKWRITRCVDRCFFAHFASQNHEYLPFSTKNTYEWLSSVLAQERRSGMFDGIFYLSWRIFRSKGSFLYKMRKSSDFTKNRKFSDFMTKKISWKIKFL